MTERTANQVCFRVLEMWLTFKYCAWSSDERNYDWTRATLLLQLSSKGQAAIGASLESDSQSFRNVTRERTFCLTRFPVGCYKKSHHTVIHTKWSERKTKNQLSALILRSKCSPLKVPATIPCACQAGREMLKIA